jgi:hypothetical protein
VKMMILIDHLNASNVEQAFTGLRYLMQGGVIKRYLYDPTDPLYEVATATEGHSRTIYGLTAAGRLLVLCSEGAYPNQGLTLYQATQLLQQNGAVVAFDGGSGGDMTCVLDGQSLLTPENPGGAERYLPAVFCISAKDGTTMSETFDYFAYTSSEPKHAIRVGPDVTQAYIANPNPIWFGGTPAKGKATAADVFTLPQDLIYNGAVVGLKGDIWRKVYDNNGHAVDGWVADIHMGKSTLSKVFIPAPSPTTKIIESLTIEPAPGTVFTWLYSDGTTDKKVI